MYLSQSELHSTKVVVIPEVGGGVVDVVDPKLQILHLLKVVVQSQTLAEGWTGGVLQFLCASKLVAREKNKQINKIMIIACPLYCLCVCLCARAPRYLSPFVSSQLLQQSTQRVRLWPDIFVQQIRTGNGELHLRNAVCHLEGDGETRSEQDRTQA